MYLGTMNVQAEVVDTTHVYKGWAKDLRYAVKPENVGYNYIFGKLILLRLYPRIHSIGEDLLSYQIDTLIFHHDYFAL